MSAKKNLRYSGAKAKREPGSFVPLPHVVMRSPQWCALSAHAVKLLLDVIAQYRGDNNGDLMLTWAEAERRGWRSRDTFDKAKGELVDREWIACTRQGGKHAPSLYAITFFALDPQSKFDISARSFPRGAWAKGPVTPIRPRRRRDTAGGSIACENGAKCHAERVTRPAVDTRAVLIEGKTAHSVTRPACPSQEVPSPRRARRFLLVAG